MMQQNRLRRAEGRRRKAYGGCSSSPRDAEIRRRSWTFLCISTRHKNPPWVPALPSPASDLDSLLKNSFLQASRKKTAGAGRGQLGAGPAWQMEAVIHCQKHCHRFLTSCLYSSVMVISLFHSSPLSLPRAWYLSTKP